MNNMRARSWINRVTWVVSLDYLGDSESVISSVITVSRIATEFQRYR